MINNPDINIKLKQNRLFIILGAAAITLVLAWFVITSVFNKTNNKNTQVVTEITLCDLDSSELCIVTFGANNLNRMVINFQLPSADYPGFYAKAKSRGNINVYPCETADAVPTSAYCTGIRTPLGESIDVEVYSTDGDILLAHGTFFVSAILLSTPAEETTSVSENGTPRATRTPTKTPTPAETETALTPTVDNGYPNPTSNAAYPNP